MNNKKQNLIINVGRSNALAKTVLALVSEAGYRLDVTIADVADQQKSYSADIGIRVVSPGVGSSAPLSMYNGNKEFDRYRRVDAATEFGKLVELLSSKEPETVKLNDEYTATINREAKEVTVPGFGVVSFETVRKVAEALK